MNRFERLSNAPLSSYLGRLGALDHQLIDWEPIIVLAQQRAQSLPEHLQIQMPQRRAGVAASTHKALRGHVRGQGLQALLPAWSLQGP